jgi:hypothetical protein
MISVEFNAIGQPQPNGDFQSAAETAVLNAVPNSNPRITTLDTGHSQITFRVDATNAAECQEIARHAIDGLLEEPYVLTASPATPSPR